MVRAYTPWDARQQEAATLVYSEADIRRLITLAATNAAPCRLVLGNNVTVTGTITIPSAIPSFSLDGGDTHALLVDGVINTLFACKTRCAFLGLAIEVSGAGSSVACLFEAPDANLANAEASGSLSLDLTVDRLSVSATTGATYPLAFFGIGGATTSRVHASQIVFQIGSLTGFFREDTSAKSWVKSTFTDLFSTSVALGIQLGHGASSPNFIDCEFDGVFSNSSISIYLNTSSTGNTFKRFDPAPATTNTNANGVNTFVGVGPFSDVGGISGTALAAGDVWLDATGFLPSAYARGSRSVATGNGIVLVKRLQLVGSQRWSLAGTARLAVI